MTYQVLARKWRPRTFQQMIGQESILRMLSNALAQDRLHHAYLFTGTRGVGKTTVARIFAKCLNCETGITATPCATCRNCVAIDEGRFLDLLEVDAASRTKVEDTRELLDNVYYQPTQGRYKIYLIDEVHMLSQHSFNALLKTLEEPPPYIKFLLATTDPKRLPITILSRCLQFHLKRVPQELLSQHLQHICQNENMAFDENALALIAHAADGSVRDSLSLLDQAIAFCHDKINIQDTQQMLGSISEDALFRLLHALQKGDGATILREIDHLNMHAANFYQALDDVLSLLHQISIAQVIPDTKVAFADIATLAKQWTPEDVQLFYQIALNGRRDLPHAPNPHQGFEMILLRMLAFRPVTKTTAPMIPPVLPQKESQKISMSPTPAKTVQEPVVLTTENGRSWVEILAKLQLTGMTYALASNCTLVAISDTKVTLSLAVQHEPMLNKKLSERIEQSLGNYLKKEVKLEIQITTTEGDTPVKKQREENSHKKAKATEAIQNDDDIQKIMGLFDATLDMDSIKTF
jgi:DNA polymerase-3 subunit gamma/tau